MTLRTRLIGVQRLAVGDTVGYGSTFRCEAPMRVGIAACGYADGYPRHCGTGTPVLVDGVRTRTVGRVSMDLITVDITHLPEVPKTLDILCPNQPVDALADVAGTIGYELLTALGPRYTRRYQERPA